MRMNVPIYYTGIIRRMQSVDHPLMPNLKQWQKGSESRREERCPADICVMILLPYIVTVVSRRRVIRLPRSRSTSEAASLPATWGAPSSGASTTPS